MPDTTPSTPPPNPEDAIPVEDGGQIQFEGATVKNTYVARQARIYPINDSQIEAIGTFNVLANICFAVGIGLLTFALGLYIDAANATGTALIDGKEIQIVITEQSGLQTVINVLCLLVGVVFFGFGLMFGCKRGKTINAIKQGN